MKRKVFIISACLMLAVSAAQSEQLPEPHAARAVGMAELEQVIGGVSTDMQWPAGEPWGQSYDNLRFQVGITNGFGTPNATIITFADNSKVGYERVSTVGPGNTGTLHRRFDWTFPGQKDLNLQYVYDGQYYDALGEPTLANQYLLSGVKVHQVKFWNASSPSMSTSVPAQVGRGLVDNYAAAIPTRNTNVDGIYAENCSVGNKTQWRYAGTGTATLSDACIDMNASGSGYSDCLDEFNANYAADTDTVHVVWVKSNASAGHAGVHWQPPGGSYMITMREDWESNSDVDALLAHELGHIYIGGHTNASENCNLARTDRNVMCSNVGRVMNATQCTLAEASSLYQDHN